MIDLNQKVEIKWNGANKNYYIDKGYEFTNYKDSFLVSVKDLSPGSDIFIDCNCDICQNPLHIRYNQYTRTIKRYGILRCYSCSHSTNVYENKTDKKGLYQRFVNFCINNNYEIISSEDDCKNGKSLLYYRCPIHGISTIKANDIHDHTIGCQGCVNEHLSEVNSFDSEHVKMIVESKNNNILLNPEDYINCKTSNLKVICGTCGNLFTTSLSSIMNSCGHCSECGQTISGQSLKISTDELIARMPGIINPEDYISSNVRNLKMRCIECGEIFETSLSGYEYFNQHRCAKCSKSKSIGEIIIEELLKKYEINFVPQKKYEDCIDKKPLPFDFYLQDYNCCIEFNGQFHYQPIYGQERLDYVQSHDKIKSEYCLNNKIKLIVIPYWEGHNIEKIITDELCIINQNYQKELEYKFH